MGPERKEEGKVELFRCRINSFAFRKEIYFFVPIRILKTLHFFLYSAIINDDKIIKKNVQIYYFFRNNNNNDVK